MQNKYTIQLITVKNGTNKNYYIVLTKGGSKKIKWHLGIIIMNSKKKKKYIYISLKGFNKFLSNYNNIIISNYYSRWIDHIIKILMLINFRKKNIMCLY